MPYEGMLAETVTVNGHNGDEIEAYYARPLGAVADDHRITFLQQPQCAMQADALAGAGDQDWGRGKSHGTLASRYRQNYTSDRGCVGAAGRRSTP